jgi:hypothetical protein
MEHQINLYLDLEPGELADLEVVAKASLAFAGAERNITRVIHIRTEDDADDLFSEQ